MTVSSSLTVEVKSSPLGNRYIARRTDVTVLSSDDTNTAGQRAYVERLRHYDFHFADYYRYAGEVGRNNEIIGNPKVFPRGCWGHGSDSFPVSGRDL